LDILVDLTEADLYHFISDTMSVEQIRNALANANRGIERGITNFMAVTPEESERLKNSLTSRKDGKLVHDINEWILDKNDVEFTKKLAEGLTGKVYKGLFKGLPVAIKVLKTSEALDAFKKEFMMMSSIRTPFMIGFHGILLQPQVAMVMDLASRGSLFDVLVNPKKSDRLDHVL